jgi:hypothetical protein
MIKNTYGGVSSLHKNKATMLILLLCTSTRLFWERCRKLFGWLLRVQQIVNIAFLFYSRWISAGAEAPERSRSIGAEHLKQKVRRSRPLGCTGRAILRGQASSIRARESWRSLCMPASSRHPPFVSSLSNPSSLPRAALSACAVGRRWLPRADPRPPLRRATPVQSPFQCRRPSPQSRFDLWRPPLFFLLKNSG